MASPGVLLRTFLSLVFVVCLNAITFPGNPIQYSMWPKWNACTNASISLEFKTTKKDGLLLYTDDNGRNDFFQLMLKDGHVNLTLNIVDGQDGRVLISVGKNLNDNKWHKVTFTRNRMETILKVDDSRQDRGIAIGSDFNFGNTATNNLVYIGGLPVRFKSPDGLRSLSAPSVNFEPLFEGSIRNVLYSNCSCKLQRGWVMESLAAQIEPNEACDISNPCGDDCLCISTNSGPACDCEHDLECKPDVTAYYHLPMDYMLGTTVLNPSGLDATAQGSPLEVRGVSGGALSLDGSRQWIRVSGPGHRFECFGDLDKCSEGYTLMLWVQFRNIDDKQKGVYMSNGGHTEESHGIAMIYSKGLLEFKFRLKSGKEWHLKYDNLLPERWYHVSVVWTQKDGISLYINGELVTDNVKPSHGVAAPQQIEENDFVIGRSNDGTGTSQLGTIVVDELQFWSSAKTAAEVKELGPIYKYYMPMEDLSNSHMTGRNLRPDIHGDPSIVSGKMGKALSLDGEDSYVDFGSYTDTCLGDLGRCISGFYLSLWISFVKLDDGTYFISTGPKGFSLYYRNNRLYATAVQGDHEWTTSLYGPEVGRWYFLEFSVNNGLTMHVDLEPKRTQRHYTAHLEEETAYPNFYVGRGNVDVVKHYAAALFDDLEIFYGDRETLLYVDFIQRDKPTHQKFAFDEMSGTRLTHPSLMINTYGSPKLVPAKIGNGLSLAGGETRQVADIGEHPETCLGNLDLCTHGAYAAFWMKPDAPEENMYYMSSGLNGFSVFYKDKKLHAEFATTTKIWGVSTDQWYPGEWQFVELSLDPEKGLKMYVADTVVAHSNVKVSRDLDADEPLSTSLDHFYVGRGNVDMREYKYGAGVIDELEYWYAPRDYLVAFDYIQRARPTAYLLDMESIRRGHLVHPTLRLPLHGDLKLVPGKVGNALQLTGNGEYVDMGEHRDECLGNFQKCQHGMTMRFWAKFERFENDMYYYSSGSDGIQIYYRGGYMYFVVKQPGQVWQAAVPRQEWFDTDIWYFIEVSWHPEQGLLVFVDGKQAYKVSDPKQRDTTQTSLNHVYLGRANFADDRGSAFKNGVITLDEVEFWYGRRDELMAFEYILSDHIGHESFSMEAATDGIMDHTKFNVTLDRGGSIVTGRYGNAVYLNGNGQYVNLGNHNRRCLGNLERCHHGLMISLWLKAPRLTNDMYFLSSPAYSIYYTNGRLHATFNTKKKKVPTATLS